MEETQEQHNLVTDGNSALPFALAEGRDEMNLAEFPLAAISDRVPNNQKTLSFEDKIYDYGKSEMITRRLTISASDKYGLPTSLDDEVILGLIQLTKKNRFTERKVSFSRYELIQLLGWQHGGRSYERLEKSLMRWLGVTLYYDKAWWDKEAMSWVNESFHVLESVTLYDQERRLKTLRSGRTEPPLSSFTWNEVVFRSFKAGNLRAIDFNAFRALRYAASKRMYRFLDKHFWKKSRWEFELRDFACEHVGLSRTYDTGQLKRRLRPAIEELEQANFLEPLTEKQRYVKLARGEWRIVLMQKRRKERPSLSPEAVELSQKLVAHGVTEGMARKLVQGFPAELIEAQLEALLRLQTKKKVIQNPAGYLVNAIREGYVQPKAMPESPKPTATIRPTLAKRSKSQREAKPDPAATAVKEYLDSLTAAGRVELETQAMKSARVALTEGLQRSEGKPRYELYRRMIIEEEVRRILNARALGNAS